MNNSLDPFPLHIVKYFKNYNNVKVKNIKEKISTKIIKELNLINVGKKFGIDYQI